MKPRCAYCDGESGSTKTSVKNGGAVPAANRRWRVVRFSAMLTVGVMALLPAVADALPGGCVDSPENPSVVLGLAGGAVVGLSFLWTRWRAK
jgi:XrtJ-associated TM-motif-TM protein